MIRSATGRRAEIARRILIVTYYSCVAILLDVLLQPASTSGPDIGSGLVDLIPRFYWLNCGAWFLSVVLVILVRREVVVSVLAGLPIALVGYGAFLLNDAGIIRVVWHGLIGGSVFGAVLVNTIVLETASPLEALAAGTGLTPPEGARRLLADVRRDLFQILRVVTQGTLAFGAITGVTMTILFRPGYEDPQRVTAGVAMASGFFFCGLGFYFWIAAPALIWVSKTRLLERTLVVRSGDGRGSPPLLATLGLLAASLIGRTMLSTRARPSRRQDP